jgi:hypothetical protein
MSTAVGLWLELPVAEAVYLDIQFFTQAADLALADAIQPQRFYQVVHPTRADPLYVRFTHGRHQRPLRSLAWFQQAWKEGAIAHPRHPQLERAYPCIPVPVAVAVAFALSLRAALVPVGAQMLGHLQFHQRLRHHAYALA